MQKGLADAKTSTSRTLGAMRTLAVGAGVAAAGAVAAIGTSALNVSNETDKATKKIRAQLRTTEAEAKRLGKAALGVFKNNFADSIEESGEAVMLLSEQLGDAARGQEQALAEAAFGLRDAFGPEVDKVIAAVSTLTDEFEDLDPTQAMDLVVTGFQRGLDKSGDFLESIGEYSNLFADAEFSAAEFFSTMETGQAGGVLGTDKIADAMKEFQIRLTEGNEDVREALTEVGLDADEIFTGLSDGTLSVKDVWEQLLPAINAIDDPLKRNRILVALLGTQAEDLGTDFTTGLDSGKTSLKEMEGASESLNTQYDNLQDNLSGVWRTLITELSPLTDDIVEMANTVLPEINKWLTENLPGIVAAVQDIRNLKINDLLEMPAIRIFLIKLKLRWFIIRRNFLRWLTTAAQRISDFFEAPLSDPLVQELKDTWEKVETAFKDWVVDHLIADYVQLPESATWAEVLKAVWQSAKSLFDGWVTSANMAIRDYLGLPDSGTWAADIKTAWSTAKATFDSWITSAGMAIRDYVQLPESATWAEVLKAVWQSAKSLFDGWVTSANMAIRDYLGLPDSGTWAADIKTAWSTAKATFDSWITSAGMAIRDYVQLPESATWAEVLKAVWQSAKSLFDGWVTSANMAIRDYLGLPDSGTWAADIKTAWSTAKATFDSWITSAGMAIRDYVQLPESATWAEVLKAVWQSAKSLFDGWVTSANMAIRDYLGLPDSGTWAADIKTAWSTAKATFDSWITSAGMAIRDYVQLPESATWGQTLRAVWESVQSGFQTWLTTANMKLSEFWQLPAVQEFVEKLRDMWDGPEGAKTVFENWLAHPENRPKITFGYEAPDPESEETRGFFAQLKQTLLAGLNTLFGDIDFFGSLLAPIVAALGTDPEAGFQGIIDKITGALKEVEDAFNTADEAIDTFFENFNADTIGPLMNEWAVGIGEGFRNLWGWIADIWAGAWDGLNNIVQTAWGALTLFLTDSFAMLGDAFAIVMIWINQGWAAGWETIKTTVANAWTEIQATMENLFAGFGEWVNDRVSDLGNGIVAIANSIIDVINSIVAAINKPIRGWNALQFTMPGFSRTIGGGTFLGQEVPSLTMGWGGIIIGTPDVALLNTVSPIGYGSGGGGQANPNIVMLASGGLALGPTMAMIGEREPEAVLRMDQLRDFANVGDGGGKPDLHLHIENAYGVDNLVDQINEAWLDGRLRGLQDQLAGVG